jgi:anti-anti-sigma regulatory factor
VLAAWTSLTLRLGLFQHPRLVRNTFRIAETKSGRTWARLHGRLSPEGASVHVERRPTSTVWLRLEGSLTGTSAERFATSLRAAMARKKERVVLDLGRVADIEESAARRLVEGLQGYRHRIRVVLPRVGESAAIAAVFASYR